eukprot:TRINITY_DN39796_c0_g1_i1.p1 TRINITY_DN39796_c0_g1~~TRINITY_DN39796_c0_g1_i1.p1  ORF type:complete len:177 (-),score=18.12 TRINITY_DN39796_c0_g1_i1:46-576(-)
MAEDDVVSGRQRRSRSALSGSMVERGTATPTPSEARVPSSRGLSRAASSGAASTGRRNGTERGRERGRPRTGGGEGCDEILDIINRYEMKVPEGSSRAALREQLWRAAEVAPTFFGTPVPRVLPLPTTSLLELPKYKLTRGMPHMDHLVANPDINPTARSLQRAMTITPPAKVSYR